MPHFYQFYENFKENKERLTIQKAVEKISIPQLVIHGDKDTSIAIDEAYKIHSWNANSILEVIENANHVFNVSHPWIEDSCSEVFEKTIRSCINFLKQ
jgi:pimeloyl-ACP methyl ester carboxylesterase